MHEFLCSSIFVTTSLSHAAHYDFRTPMLLFD